MTNDRSPLGNLSKCSLRGDRFTHIGNEERKWESQEVLSASRLIVSTNDTIRAGTYRTRRLGRPVRPPEGRERKKLELSLLQQ